mmetsp:Transcript_22069/g.22256  ORF Transcript_22069/g.22256 Transcript_22069/m.22256 type:complete len:141 (-) Transcript_22069:578-1000(-)
MWLIKSVLSGLFASCASLIGKLALSPDSYVISALFDICTRSISHEEALCLKVCLAGRMVSLGGMFLCNAVMLSYFLQALECGNSLPVTVLNSAVSFLITGCFGVFLLAEPVNSTWLLGVALIILGVLCIGYSQKETRRIE